MTDQHPGPPWRYRIGTKLYDKTHTWIVGRNVIGVRRWIKIKKSREFKFRSFEVNRNNSVIVPKANEYITLCLTKGGYFHLMLSSRYIPEADGVVISKHLSEMDISISYAVIGNVDISFVHKKAHYVVSIGTRWRKRLIRMLKKYNAGEFFGFDRMSSLPRTVQHHFGTLRLFTTDVLKKLKVGEQYYLVCGMNWDRDYTGKQSIIVLQYGVPFINPSIKYDIRGTITSYHAKDNRYICTDPYLRLNENGEFVTKYNATHVHIVEKWRAGFRPPLGLIQAKTLSDR